MEQVLGGDQLQDRVAEVFEPLVIRGAALRMLVVVRAMRQRLPQQGNIVEANPERALELL